MDIIAHDMGRSKSWVSRVHTKALKRLGARLRAEAF
jgi:DNA-directed RNA polymerase specialized sigma subunit